MIKDSGSRTEFETGAVRDVQTLEKGRCDLLPFDTLAEAFSIEFGDDDHTHKIMGCISLFVETGNSIHLFNALGEYLEESDFKSWSDMILEVAIHMAEGCAKYGERNWEKGIPLPRFIDSGVRHYLKWLRGDKDERHDRAFCWNILCAIWTTKHKPKLNEYGKGGRKDG